MPTLLTMNARVYTLRIRATVERPQKTAKTMVKLFWTGVMLKKSGVCPGGGGMIPTISVEFAGGAAAAEAIVGGLPRRPGGDAGSFLRLCGEKKKRKKQKASDSPNPQFDP